MENETYDVFLEKDDLNDLRNEGSGGSNVILVAVGSEVWELSFKVALHGSVMFHELQISYKLLTHLVGSY